MNPRADFIQRVGAGMTTQADMPLLDELLGAHWIPADSRHRDTWPDLEEDVLVVCRTSDGWRYVHIAYLGEDRHWQSTALERAWGQSSIPSDLVTELDEVTHWQPLPGLPKED